MKTYGWPLLLFYFSACDAASTDAGEGIENPPVEATQVRLTAQLGSGEGLRLRDKSVLPDGNGADLRLGVAMVMSLRATYPMSICAKGTFASLYDIPMDVDSCPKNPIDGWVNFAYLSASSTHTEAESTVAGLGLLVRSKDDDALFRLRILGDSYNPQDGAAVRFEFAPTR